MEQEIEQEISETENDLEQLQTRFQQLESMVEQLQDQKLSNLAEKVNLETSDIDVDELQDFLKRPYLVNEAGDDRYEIVVPAFLDFQVGRLDRQVNQYNVFVVDKYTKWMTGVPDFLQNEIDLDDDSSFQVEGDVLEFDEPQQDQVENDPDIQDHVSTVSEGKATVKQGHEFELIAELIERGELPFTPQPVQDEDRRDPEVEFELRDYQQDGYQRFLDEGHACFCWMTGAGKSFPALLALDSLRYDPDDAKKAVVVYGKATEQQWNQYFEEYAPRLADEVEVVTYQSMDKLDGEYILIVFDECHALPADTFAKGATIPTTYRIGLTASPYREDDRQNYIFALTGPPVGLDWEHTLDLMDKSYHEINIHIVDDRREKIDRIQEILDDRRTLIFCDSLDFGEEIADATGLTFVNGEDRNQLEKIQDNEQVIVSRIGDHGISLDNLQVVLEADFLYGSRRQEIQRTGRLFHGEGERHDIFFTRGEFNKHKKRLYSLIEKGFSLNFVDEGESLEVPEKYENRIDLDLDGEPVGTERSNGGRMDPSEADLLDLLKNHKEEVNDRIEAAPKGTKENVWKMLYAVAKSDDGLSHQEMAEIAGYSKKTASAATRTLRNNEPPILVDASSSGKYKVNREAFERLEEAKQQAEEAEEFLEDVGVA